jgi:hypothetical protein
VIGHGNFPAGAGCDAKDIPVTNLSGVRGSAPKLLAIGEDAFRMAAARRLNLNWCERFAEADELIES